MNILVLSPFLPYPLDQGGKIRVYNLIANLAKVHTITLAAFVDDRRAADVAPLRQLCAEVVLVERPARLWPDRLAFFTGRDPYNVIRYSSAAMRRELMLLLQRQTFDLVQVEFPMMWQYADILAPIPVVLDAHNIEHKNVRQIGDAHTSPLWRNVPSSGSSTSTIEPCFTSAGSACLGPSNSCVASAFSSALPFSALMFSRSRS